MRPGPYHRYKQLCNLYYNASYAFRSNAPTANAFDYTKYGFYLADLWAPRVSFQDTTSDAYRNQLDNHNIYYVYGILGFTLIYNMSQTDKCKKDAEAKFLTYRA